MGVELAVEVRGHLELVEPNGGLRDSALRFVRSTFFVAENLERLLGFVQQRLNASERVGLFAQLGQLFHDELRRRRIGPEIFRARAVLELA